MVGHVGYHIDRRLQNMVLVGHSDLCSGRSRGSHVDVSDGVLFPGVPNRFLIARKLQKVALHDSIQRMMTCNGFILIPSWKSQSILRTSQLLLGHSGHCARRRLKPQYWQTTLKMVNQFYSSHATCNVIHHSTVSTFRQCPYFYRNVASNCKYVISVVF